jgi:CHAT domain-containing protein
VGLVALALAALVAVVRPALAQDGKSAPARAERERQARERTQLVEKLYKQGKLEEATQVARQALALARQLYLKDQYPDGHPDLARSLNILGFLLQARGDYAGAEPYLRDALAMRQKLYPKARYPGGHPDLARSLNNLGNLLEAQGEYGQAEPFFRDALAMLRKLYPPTRYPDGHPDLATSLNTLGFLLQARGEYAQAESFVRDALAMRQQLYPPTRYHDGHPDLARSLNNLGGLLKDRGAYAQAEPFVRDALAMLKKLYPRTRYPDGHPHLALSLNNLGSLLQARGEYAQAEPFVRDALAMRQQLYSKTRYPDGHADLAQSLNNLGNLLQARGESAQAEPFYRDALAMLKKLYPRTRYPDGHRELALSLNNLGSFLQARGAYAQAEPFVRDALAMRQQLYPTKTRYPDGHPDLATSLNNLGVLLQARGAYAQADSFARDALAMQRNLYPPTRYPDGHPELALSLNNLGMLLEARGAYGQAEPFFREALAMQQQLYPPTRYPDGHPHLALSLNNLGMLLQARGESAQAEPFYRDALALYLALSSRLADTAAEAQALNYAASLPLTRDGYLSVTQGRRADPRVYDLLWQTRSALTRIAERRHRDLLASRDPEARQLALQLQQQRERLAQLFWSPLADGAAHRRAVQQGTAAKEELEQRLARQLRLAAPAAAAQPPLPPQHLIDRLPAGVAFVDCYRYTHFRFDPKVRGRKGETRTPAYVAFVLQRQRPPVRVELGSAAALEGAWAAWHKALLTNSPEERQAAAAFAQRAWQPLRPHLPAGLHTVYLAPDGELTRLPWAALPGRQPGTMLLEETALALVPHGPFLLERLGHAPPRPPSGIALVLGGVGYQNAPLAVAAARKLEMVGVEAAPQRQPLQWLALPGTDRERHLVAALARKALGAEPRERSGAAASTAQVVADLPAVRYAHLATHGFFANPQFQKAARLDPDLFRPTRSDRQLGARSPLTLSGLVLAGANLQGQEAAPDRGILTAEGIVGLRLEDLEVAVLSACETGLGTVDELGEGVFGLQRAFHVAGCRHVVASLWQVEDEATAALMRLFYRNLWVEKQDALQALRQAQLFLYRNPQAIPAMAQLRSADFAVTELPKVASAPAGAAGRRAPVRQWAAFTFSGVVPTTKAVP